MGYQRHHAIVVTSWGDEHIEPAHAFAIACFRDTHAAVSEITSAGMNDYRSFFVAPDGSKEGWPDSDRADAAREQFVAWLREPGPPWLDWVEVNFGGDDEERMGVRGAHGSVRCWEDRDGQARSEAELAVVVEE